MANPKTNASEFTVSEISGEIKRAVEENFGHVRIRGEISGFRGQHSSGHAYFALKDEKARIDAIIWRGVFGKLKFKPEEGLEVIATGKVTTYPGSSKYQIMIESLEPAGVGALMALLEERRKKLAAEGLFDDDRKKPLPYMPKSIGVITSPTGAVIRDILHRLEDRFPTNVTVWPVRVQGETCGDEVSNAINWFNQMTPDDGRPDLIIVARGGGSLEDLWGFNDESVVRAVAASDIPIISAIGHETDTTLIDFVADRRAPTPTGAAEMAVPVRTELLSLVEDLARRNSTGLRRTLSEKSDKLRAAKAGLPKLQDLTAANNQRLDTATLNLNNSLRMLLSEKRAALAVASRSLSPTILRQRNTRAAQQVNQWHARLTPAITRSLNDRKTRLGQINLTTQVARQMQLRHQGLGAMAKLLTSYSYTNVLSRGFALVRDASGTPVKQGSSLSSGEAIQIEFADTSVNAAITGGSPAKPKPKPAKKPSATDEDQTSLF